MNVLLVSQCNKNALVETRRILDQFAERKGNRVWQTPITEAGLRTLHKMLCRRARRNTAVACHWIKSANHSELLWIVGNRRCFNEVGTVPTNMTTQNVLKSSQDTLWHTLEVITLLASLAGLFHDFGKANKLFQQKLRNHSAPRSEPLRHEWISLRLFQAFVRDRSDEEWLRALHSLPSDDSEQKLLIEALVKDQPDKRENPFRDMPPLARVVGWLIVTHHRLLQVHDYQAAVPLQRLAKGLSGKKFPDPTWNSPQFLNAKDPQLLMDVFSFPDGLPLLSEIWRQKALQLAKRALRHPTLWQSSKWMDERFPLHLARLVLMLADHFYSAGPPNLKWQSPKYKAYANTERESGELKQQLDEHNLGVAHTAYQLSRTLPHLRERLPGICGHRTLRQRTIVQRFRWQNQAYEKALGVARKSQQQGFFGVNMASTGCGKTFANARIMYGLSNEREGCRFSVALGLRTLTLQTGDMLRDHLRLSETDLAVLIGSSAVLKLHQGDADQKVIEYEEATGSASAQPFFAEHEYVRYEGELLQDERWRNWLEHSPKLGSLLSSPVLACTVDHLIPATESQRGGKQIVPMLRLMTSDLVLDEPDDFGLEDLPALCRLVHWAGVLGSRVLLSSATLPPALVETMFDAYATGWREFQRNRAENPTAPLAVCCLWTDEHSCITNEVGTTSDFVQRHHDFVGKRVAALEKFPALRQVVLCPITSENGDTEAVAQAFSAKISHEIKELHSRHHQQHPQTSQRVSFGLVRMANIRRLVAVARHLLSIELTPSRQQRFVCVYHSQHPLLIRSRIERELDGLLQRHDPLLLWKHPTIQTKLREFPQDDLIFLVLATPVAEVGRDHDYDWIIAEPSSMRSLIQLAGRLQRHRQQVAKSPNFLIFSRNFRALLGNRPAFVKPGFESKNDPELQLLSTDLHELLIPYQWQGLAATPRIQERQLMEPQRNLVDLEHEHLRKVLTSDADKAAQLWWEHQVTWSYELQRLTRFRASSPQETFFMGIEDARAKPQWYRDNLGEWLEANTQIHSLSLNCAAGNHIWPSLDFVKSLEEQSERDEISLRRASRRYGEITLREMRGSAVWAYHPALGVFQE
jgi:CRISPR-associated endonuclease/helicase Cas3